MIEANVYLLGVVGIGLACLVVVVLERRFATLHLGLAAMILIYAACHLAVPGPVSALYLAVISAASIGLVSKAKYRYLGFNLMAGDFWYLFSPTVELAAGEYRSAILPVAMMVALALAGASGLALVLAEVPDPPAFRIALFLAALLLFQATYRFSGGATRFRNQIMIEDRAHLSSFIASLFGAGPSRRPRFTDIDPLPLPLSPPAPGRQEAGGPKPHIIMILHESTFDPQFLGLPSPPSFRSFFEPPGGASGRLFVDVFGGGTWQTEFAVYAGISSLCFGNDSRFVFHQFAGRLKHALPLQLSGLGYRSTLLCSDRRAYVNNDRFYRSIGFGNVMYASSLPAPFDSAQWRKERHDETLYRFALGTFGQDLVSGPPLFLSIMTLMNHGSHRRMLFCPERHADIRTMALEATGSAAFGEYMVRLAETVRAYGEFRNNLERTLAGRPAIIVRFGDHHPSFTSALTGRQPSDMALHTTFYAIEAVNHALPPGFCAPESLDAAFLSTLAQIAAGLPLDAVTATRAELMAARPPLYPYFASQSQAKRRFHRTLVDEGIIDLS